MKKRGQISIFIVLGIVIVTVIILSFAFRDKILEKSSEIGLAKSEKVKKIESQLQEYSTLCLKKISTEGLIRVLADGGYYNNAKKSLRHSIYTIPYFRYDGKDYFPSKETIAVSLANYIEDNINVCLRVYPAKIKIGKPKVEVTFGKDVKVKVRQSIKQKLSGSSATIKSFHTTINFNLDRIYLPANELFELVKVLNSSDIVKRANSVANNRYKLITPDIKDDVSVFILKFNRTINDELDTDFTFAIKHKEEEFSDDAWSFLDIANIFSDLFSASDSSSVEEIEQEAEPVEEKEDIEEDLSLDNNILPPEKVNELLEEKEDIDYEEMLLAQKEGLNPADDYKLPADLYPDLKEGETSA